jgi:hypothetical protein
MPERAEQFAYNVKILAEFILAYPEPSMWMERRRLVR